ncbi:prolyl oligopeptidase family serine peptidase [Polaribacter sp. IC066]|uniref:S9 family peptidase n=1 Tax=Polaribacter sp. IC066 TaxID=57032 RepID=UPI0011BF127B|nr:DPP IV N-terminal domain-containing protein [Polaribacter sp. IC066]TXD60264.1 prolyl oligopeptidase family serine peptidase [Polaribacter sp. IC066]
MVRNIVLLFVGLVLASCSNTKTEITQQDYKNAVSFMYENYGNKTAFNLYTSVSWFDDESGIWFVDYSKENKTYNKVDFKNSSKVEELFDHAKLAGALNKIEEVAVTENDLVLTNIEKVANGLSFTFKAKNYIVDLTSYEITEEKKEEEKKQSEFESKSPDGKWTAYVNNYNLFIKSTKTKRKYQLSFNGKKGYEYASWYGWADIMKGENGDRPKHFSVDWSSDSKWIYTQVVDTRNAEKMYLLDWSKDELFKPELLSYYRGSPGDTTMVMIKPVFYNVTTKLEVASKLPTQTHINAVRSQWTNESGVLLADVMQRGFQKEEIIEVDLNTQKQKVLITETSKTNIDNFEYRFLEDAQKIIFLSERTGWRQLHMFDLKTNTTNLLTSDTYVVNDIEHIDEKAGVIYYLASGKEVDNNPYHQQVYKVNFKGEETLLTPEKTNHEVSFSKDGSYFVDSYSTIKIPTKTVLRSSETGEILSALTQADVSDAISKGWETPEVFEFTAKDNKTTIYGALWKPTNFDASKQYPIIDNSYTGPHTQVFPEQFDLGFSNQSLAELGFIVVAVDGLGTSGRSKEFLNHSYKNMGNNLEDHVLVIKKLAKKYAWINGEKVGIFGHSAGGYDAGHAMVAFPDFYKVAVASSADHDFRMEKAWWPEMYQGWPVDSTYHEVSNITMAKNLKGKLLLVHGGIDDNVNPSATFKFAEALIKADKEFDLLILPSQRHSYQGAYKNYFIKKRWNYFVEHLGNQTPIWDFEMKKEEL